VIEMPNWCSNTTYVFGKDDKVRLFEAAISERNNEEGFIPTLYPCPQELKDSPATFVDMANPIPENWKNLVAEGTWTQDTYDERVAETLADMERKKALIEKYGFKDWYDWSLYHWGTKWGDCDLRIEESYRNSNSDDTRTLELKYDTAWGPALEALTHISTLFPKLIFYTFYSETGIGFQGYHKVCNGEVIIDQSADYIPTADDYEWIINGEDESEIDGMVN
jgi:hypothetical protein